MSHCEFCECWDCRESRRQEERLVRLDALVQRANWNMSPAELAQEIRDTYHGHFELNEILDHFRKRGFDSHELDSVRDAYEVFCQ